MNNSVNINNIADIRQWYYRGSLKSCNYSCSYCPFSKNPATSSRELKSDETNLIRFVDFILKTKSSDKNKCAVQIVPYGEALIHRYYWRELARLSRCEGIEAVGAQTNLSFNIENMLEEYKKNKGDIKKLRLWCTFHPTMTDIESFLLQCKMLSDSGVIYCAGAVGNPSEINLLKKLRKSLPKNVYFWINKMDGLKRKYTDEEIESFTEIDDYFEMELRHHKADLSRCVGSCFVEADGNMHRCNICRQSMGNLYEYDAAYFCENVFNGENENRDSGIKDNMYISEGKDLKDLSLEKDLKELNFEKEVLIENNLKNDACNKGLMCTRKECSCYLSYCNQEKPELVFFNPYPAFRIPKYPKAVFFDIDGTLVNDGEKRISDETAKRLHRLAAHSSIFLATSLPYKDALKKLGKIKDIIAGGVFAGGGMCLVNDLNGMTDRYEALLPIDSKFEEFLKENERKYGYKLHIYKKNELKKDSTVIYNAKNNDIIYKITLSFNRNSNIAHDRKNENAEKTAVKLGLLDENLNVSADDKIKVVIEDGCIQIVNSRAGKKEGISDICTKLGFLPEETAVFGNSINDISMLKAYEFSVVVNASDDKVIDAAKYKVNISKQ